MEPLNTRKAQLITDFGVLERTFAYGLGAGLFLNTDIGGEIRGYGMERADGVWLYQFDIGTLVLDQLESSTTKTIRRDQWQEIYNRKARRLDAEDSPLHYFGGYEMFTTQQWEDQVRLLVEPLAPQLTQQTGSADPVSVLEVGVGAGAFISAVSATYPGISMNGLDSAWETIRVAKKRLQGKFYISGVEDLAKMFEPRSYDCVMSFGVITYLENEEVVKQKFRDMIKLAKKCVYVGEVSDLEKKHIADKLRKKTHVNATGKQAHVSSYTPPHLYVPKNLFEDVASEMGFVARTQDHDALGLTYATAAYRFSVYVDLTSRKAEL
jgi:2-polyprenyl-3-methyl-5-hydroxy-6-metoxy-1,4-benzoquinol methylase